MLLNYSLVVKSTYGLASSLVVVVLLRQSVSVGVVWALAAVSVTGLHFLYPGILVSWG